MTSFDPTFDLDEDVSRHAIRYARWGGPKDLATGRAYLALGDKIGREGTPRVGEVRSKALSRVGRVIGTDEFVIVDRGVLEAALTIEPTPPPARFTKASKLTGAAFLDAFFDREAGGPWFTSRDERVFAALREWATRSRPSQEALNLANHGICLAVLARAGIVQHPRQLPGWPQ